MERPYNFDEDVKYMIQTLGKSRWVVRGIGKLTLEKALKWKIIADKSSHSMRIRKRLPNGGWDSSWCASTPYGALIAIIRYLDAKKRLPKKHKDDGSLIESEKEE